MRPEEFAAQAGPKLQKAALLRAEFRLLDKANKSITWHGLNAMEADRIARMETDDWRRARQVFGLGSTWTSSRKSRFALPAVALVCLIWFVLPPNFSWVGVLVAVSVGALGYVDGKGTGEGDGYQQGHRAGVFKVLELTDEEARNIHDEAIRMEVEGRLVQRLDEADNEAAAKAVTKSQPPAP